MQDTRSGVCEQASRLRSAHLGRREVLRIGALSALGLTTTQLGALRAADAAPRTDRACILLWLSGGPSQLDTFDPKPDAPAEIRSPFAPIGTSVPGIQVTELFPRLARQAHHYALLRSVYHTLDDHARGMCWLLAGRLHDSIRYPNMGSVVARLRQKPGALPAFVTIPRMNLVAGLSATDHAQTAGDLGRSWDPLTPDGVPGVEGFRLTDLDLPREVSTERFQRRVQLLDRNEAAESGGGQDDLRRRAVELVRSDRIRAAFDLEAEPTALRDRYGRHGFGQSTLLARRLVERGVQFVNVNWPNYYQWDHHTEYAGRMQYQAPPLDFALGSLLEDLADRGMLDSTLVLCMGEFGRTPKVNVHAGRDHWVHVMTVLAAGAGIRGGQAIGSSTSDGGYPHDRPIHARDVVASAYHALGIDPLTELHTFDGRPFQLLPNAEIVPELFHRTPSAGRSLTTRS